jgi:aminopeptidase
MNVHDISGSIDSVKLDKLAQVAVRVGLRLQAGQDLILSAPVAALPLVRRVAARVVVFRKGEWVSDSGLSGE